MRKPHNNFSREQLGKMGKNGYSCETLKIILYLCLIWKIQKCPKNLFFLDYFVGLGNMSLI